MQRTKVMALLLLAGLGQVAGSCELAELDFLTRVDGNKQANEAQVWLSDSDGNRTTESWQWVSDSTLEGQGQLIDLETLEVVYSESLRLVEMDGSIFYIAKPDQNAMPTAFKLTSCEDNRFVFENPEHDFPKRIEYVKKDRGVDVLVSDGAEKGFKVEFQ